MGSGSSSLKSMSAGKKSTSPAGRQVKEEPRISPTPEKDSPSGSKLLPKEKVSKKTPKVTKLQVEKWTSGINALFEPFPDEQGIAEFREYLHERWPEGEKYLDFLQECYHFKMEMSRLQQKATEIFDTFLGVASPREITVEEKNLIEVESKLEQLNVENPKNLFKDTQEGAKDKLNVKLYAKFCEYLRTEKYKTVIQG